MYSISFPNMFTSARTLLVKDHEATLSNLKLALQSARKSLFGDPYYGNNLQTAIFAQNSAILRDLVVDEIYTCILEFTPQFSVKRSDITVWSKDNSLYATIKGLNLIDYVNDLYTIKLTDEIDES